MISLIIPSYNNLEHLKNAYTSVRKFYPDVELILMDDGSTDGTYEWIMDKHNIDEYTFAYRSDERVGHTILYDRGIERATNEIVGILHADMIIGQNYVENLLKHLERGKVVCATRIEPPLHPAGHEKIIKDFGQDFDELDNDGFEEFVTDLQERFDGETTRGMFAPWILYKEDFEAIGGHDPLFAPFPYEDSDIFQRWILNGYELIQSRDSFVYHLTCRGHRWTEEIQKDDEYYKEVSQKAQRNYIRKWGSWVENDKYQYPIIHPKYNIGFIIENCNGGLLNALEPWCDVCYVDCDYESYVEDEQPNTQYDMYERVQPIGNDKNCEILVKLDGKNLSHQDFQLIQKLPQIISDSGSIGEFNIGNLKIDIVQMNTYENDLINV